MAYSFKDYENGLSNAVRIISERDALNEACKLISVFLSVHTGCNERKKALFVAGRYAGALHDSGLFETISSIFKRCATLKQDEQLELSEREKRFIKASTKDIASKHPFE